VESNIKRHYTTINHERTLLKELTKRVQNSLIFESTKKKEQEKARKKGQNKYGYLEEFKRKNDIEGDIPLLLGNFTWTQDPAPRGQPKKVPIPIG
jgi:hypothetical protein